MSQDINVKSSLEEENESLKAKIKELEEEKSRYKNYADHLEGLVIFLRKENKAYLNTTFKLAKEAVRREDDPFGIMKWLR